MTEIIKIKSKKRRFTPARRRALAKARRKWMGMSPTARRKAMPARRKGKFKRYPAGQHILLDVGKKGGHYQFARKTKYGWKKAKAPGQLREWESGTGYVNLSSAESRRAMTKPMRRKWVKMSPAARAKAMPQWTAKRKRQAGRRR